MIIDTIALISKSFGGINLEDISAPRCFEIEAELKKRCDIPVFHDDQHGTAIVVSAALLNAIKVVGKEMGTLEIVINGAGAAGISIAKMLIQLGFGNVILFDMKGAIYEGADWLNPAQAEMPRCDEGRRCIYRRFQTEPGIPGYGPFHESGCDRVPNGKSDSGDHAG